MGKEVKGIHYFNGLFMKAEEFELEQNYHKQMHRLHNRYLHTFGIVWGLDIKKSEKPGALPSDVTVTEGMALNKVSEDGEELSKDIILIEDTDVSLAKHGAGKGIYVYISYKEDFLKKDEKDTENTYRLEGAKLDTETDRNKIKENENIILGKVTLIDKAGTLTVDKMETEEGGKSLRRYAGPSGKSLETDRITLAIAGVTSGFPTIEGKVFGSDNGILVNSAATSFSGALSVKGALNTGSNLRMPDNIGLILGTTYPVSLHNYNATPELWVEATNQASAALVIGTGFDNDKIVRIKYIPGAVGVVSGELRIGQDAKNVATFTHGYTSLYTNGAERLRVDAAGNVIMQTGSLRIAANDTFLDFGVDTRQMINLHGNGPNAAFGIGIQGWTQYYRSAGNFAWYIGGTHSDVEMEPGSGGTAALVIKRGSGNVGIGTPNPSARLHVSGTNPLVVNLGDTTISQYSDLQFLTDSGNSQIWKAGSGYSGWGGTSALNIYNSSGAIAFHPNNTANALYIASSGNVGIGTSNPGMKLQVVGGWARVGNTNDEAINFETQGTFHRIAFNELRFWDWHTGGDMVTFKDGNIGIGTTGPAARLHVEAINKPTIMAQGPFGGLMSGAGGGHGVFGTNIYVDSGNQFRTAGTHSANYGYAGMHATWGNLNFYAAPGNTTADVAINPALRLFIRGSDGYVGIGTPNPQAKLDVIGAIRAGNSDIYFTETNHNHTAIGNANGYAAIENAANYGALMILGRSTPGGRIVKVWDRMEINGVITVEGARTFLNGLDSASNHWIMCGGSTEGTHNAVGLNPVTKSFFVGGGWRKNFMIDHPLDPGNKYLTHSTLEGPESAVYYRGEAQLSNGKATVNLPDYFEALTRKENRTVLLTPKFVDDSQVSMLASSEIKKGKFIVKAIDGRNTDQKFYWEVKAIRADVDLLEVETLKSS